ncbi:carbohydrate ABC transporter permease [Oceanispirochaeta sp.]|uniref:carbohydrate ABC transporter permease n=1 Tax=Oceanispirochaeta sp. TaxID=2035350 RepID=UPI002620F684|nr:sugar ABC transporter permease [Oceanispirochaeta sp.]MDA3956576.1 sugar ABC transporter permease [Oceanispirochaeta sp.]
MGSLKIKSKNAEERKAYWIMVLPAFAIYILVMGFPIIISFILSLSNYNGGKMFGGEAWKITGFQQYSKLIVDPSFWYALRNNIYVVIISVFGQLPLGLFLAYLIYRKTVRFGDFWQGVLYVPAIISVIVIGIMWSMIFSPYGPLSEIVNKYHSHVYTRELTQIFNQEKGFLISDNLVQKIYALSGSIVDQTFSTSAEFKQFLLTYSPDQLDVLKSDLCNLFSPKWSSDFLNKRDIAMIPILFVTLWIWTGLYLILFLGNMQKISPQILEAATIDGASEGEVLIHIILPSLSGVIMNASILCIAGSLSGFDLIFAMTGGGPARITQVLSIYMYENAFMGAPNYPLANAISMTIVVFSFLLVAITKGVEKKMGGVE